MTIFQHVRLYRSLFAVAAWTKKRSCVLCFPPGRRTRMWNQFYRERFLLYGFFSQTWPMCPFLLSRLVFWPSSAQFIVLWQLVSHFVNRSVSVQDFFSVCKLPLHTCWSDISLYSQDADVVIWSDLRFPNTETVSVYCSLNNANLNQISKLVP